MPAVAEPHDFGDIASVRDVLVPSELPAGVHIAPFSDALFHFSEVVELPSFGDIDIVPPFDALVPVSGPPAGDDTFGRPRLFAVPSSGHDASAPSSG